MKEDIEKLKEAAFKLAEMAQLPITNANELKGAIAAVEAFKPKVEPFEIWAVIYPDLTLFCYFGKEDADRINDNNRNCRVAHLREVTPAPEWERWSFREFGLGYYIHVESGRRIFNVEFTRLQAEELVARHNAEMARVTGTEGK